MSPGGPKPSLGERVTGAMFWNSVLLPVKTLLTFASSVVVVRLLSQGDYALFASVIALLNTIGLWSDLGIETTLAKFIPEVEKRFGRGGVLRFLGLLLGLKFTLLAVLLPAFFAFQTQLSAFFRFGVSGNSFLFAITILLFLGILSDFLLEFLVAYFNQRATNSMDIIFALVQPILVVLFVWLGWGVPGVLLARILATLLYVLVGFAFARRTLSEVGRLPELPGNWRDLLSRFARLASVSYINSLLVFFSDYSYVVFVLNYYGDVIGVALFAVAFSRVITPIRQFFTGTLVGVPIPLFARIYVQRDFAKMQAVYAALSRLMTLFLVPVAVGLCLLAPNLLRLVFQSRYEPAAGITVILTVFLFGESLLQPAQNILVAFEENRTFLLTRSITLLSVPLLFVVVPAFGVTGAALIIGLVRIASRLYATAVVQRKFKLAFPIRFFSKVLLASGIMSIVMISVLGLERAHDVSEVAIRSGVAFVLGSSAFLIAFKKFGGIEATDRERLATLRFPFKHVLLSWL